MRRYFHGRRTGWKIAGCLFLMLFISGCTQRETEKSSGEAMYIEEAQLTEEERSIAELLGEDGRYHIFDYVLDDTARSVQVNLSELKDGAWYRLVGGGGEAIEAPAGRIALKFDNLAEGLRVASQNGGDFGAVSYQMDDREDDTGKSRATSQLSDKTVIAYDQEVPLAIQIVTSQNAIRSYDVEYYFQPEKYEKLGYEHVYAVTVRFSRKTVEELSSEDQEHEAEEPLTQDGKEETLPSSEQETVLIELDAHMKDHVTGQENRIVISSDTDQYSGAFALDIPQTVYDAADLAGGEKLHIVMYWDGEEMDQKLPVYTAVSVTPLQ